jgi:hypothetical protein
VPRRLQSPWAGIAIGFTAAPEAAPIMLHTIAMATTMMSIFQLLLIWESFMFIFCKPQYLNIFQTPASGRQHQTALEKNHG